MVHSGRTPCTEARQAVLSRLSNSKPKSVDCCQHTCTGVTLSPPGLGRAELWACSWGCRAPPALHSRSSRLSTLPVTHSTDLNSPFFSHKVSVCMCVYTHIYLCVHMCIFIYSPRYTKNLTHREPILHWGIATRKVKQTINNNLALFCASFLHEVQACDVFFFFNSRRMSSHFLVSIFFSFS